MRAVSVDGCVLPLSEALKARCGCCCEELQWERDNEVKVPTYFANCCGHSYTMRAAMMTVECEREEPAATEVETAPTAGDNDPEKGDTHEPT